MQVWLGSGTVFTSRSFHGNFSSFPTCIAFIVYLLMTIRIVLLWPQGPFPNVIYWDNWNQHLEAERDVQPKIMDTSQYSGADISLPTALSSSTQSCSLNMVIHSSWIKAYWVQSEAKENVDYLFVWLVSNIQMLGQFVLLWWRHVTIFCFFFF